MNFKVPRWSACSWPHLVATMIVFGGYLAAPGPASAQGTVEFRFSGTVSSLNPGSTVFPGVTVGSPVLGSFIIDYGAPDADPAANAGNYSSASMALWGIIGSVPFSSSMSGSGHTVRVVDGALPEGVIDWTILQMIPGGTLNELRLTFHDSAGQAITSDALPSSAAAFNAFPLMVLFATDDGNVFGSYTLNASVTIVPEPSMLGIVGSGVGLLMVLRRLLR